MEAQHRQLALLLALNRSQRSSADWYFKLVADRHRALCHLQHDSMPDSQFIDARRRARCMACNTTAVSCWRLPFFRRRQTCTTDLFYCGCYGWD